MKTTKEKKIFIDIEQAKYICDKSQYGEASFFEKLRLNIRWLYCKATREYIKRNTRLTKLIKKSNIQMLSFQDKKVMKNKLNEELLK